MTLPILLKFILGFVAGYLYGHIAEWLMHKYVLHKLGKKANNLFSFHYREHHRSSRRNDFYDAVYSPWLVRMDPAGKEAGCLLGIILLHIPVLFLSYGFFFALVVSSAEYYYKHRKAHTNIEWAKEKLVWHYDHHMGKIQDANWGVRSDFADKLFGARIYYYKNRML